MSAKTEESKKVYWLRLEREALLKRSGSDLNWKVLHFLLYVSFLRPLIVHPFSLNKMFLH